MIKNSYFATMMCCIVGIMIALTGPMHVEAASKGQPLPKSLFGTWQVTEVKVDGNSGARKYINYNDPELRGRLCMISRDKIESDMEWGMTCEGATVVPEHTTADKVIKTMEGPDPTPVYERPSPEGYKLPLAADAAVTALWLKCKKGIFYPGFALDGAKGDTWIVVLPTGQLAIASFDRSIIILSRLPVNTKPKASFDCKKAKTPTEKTICKSISLASFDQSIAEAYADAIKFVGSYGEDKVIYGQWDWLKKRDACGTDEACLLKTMRERLYELGNPENFEDNEH